MRQPKTAAGLWFARSGRAARDAELTTFPSRSMMTQMGLAVIDEEIERGLTNVFLQQTYPRLYRRQPGGFLLVG